ncbi:T9SS type A sorting domain-containing protein, partial [candidate division WOR-3 bacterium]|nr:T9SS type A sorting domain-containing protein [candidate division WOR-3 bacterium]
IILYEGFAGPPYRSNRIFGIIAEDTGVEKEKEKPQALTLNCYPNPCFGTLTVKFFVHKGGKGSLKIYDITGRLVKTLVNGNKKPGDYTVNWDAKNVPSGIYFIKLSAGDFKATKKLILMR